MPDGKPDLSGVYGNAGLPAGNDAAGTEARRREVPHRPRRARTTCAGRTTLTTGNDCKPLGIPQTYITPYPFQFVQTPS